MIVKMMMMYRSCVVMLTTRTTFYERSEVSIFAEFLFYIHQLSTTKIHEQLDVTTTLYFPPTYLPTSIYYVPRSDRNEDRFAKCSSHFFLSDGTAIVRVLKVLARGELHEVRRRTVRDGNAPLGLLNEF